jgi:hypothetical protein
VIRGVSNRTSAKFSLGFFSFRCLSSFHHCSVPTQHSPGITLSHTCVVSGNSFSSGDASLESGSVSVVNTRVIYTTTRDVQIDRESNATAVLVSLPPGFSDNIILSSTARFLSLTFSKQNCVFISCFPTVLQVSSSYRCAAHSARYEARF